MSERKINQSLKSALELGPVAVFFIAYIILKDRMFSFGGVEYQGFIVVTAGFVPLILLSTAILWRISGRLSKMQVITAILVVAFGGMSVMFNDPKFIKMKPTVLYLAFGGVLAFGLLQGRSYLKYVMEEIAPLTDVGWMILTKRVTLLFLGLAALNELVWRTQSEEVWVYFKTFGLIALIVAFFISQGSLFSRYSMENGDNTSD
ncbi:MAG: septation protein IspZ [Roseovarius sp.]|nr:septation protein IspZ [Roseovarius sp.]